MQVLNLRLVYIAVCHSFRSTGKFQWPTCQNLLNYLFYLLSGIQPKFRQSHRALWYSQSQLDKVETQRLWTFTSFVWCWLTAFGYGKECCVYMDRKSNLAACLLFSEVLQCIGWNKFLAPKLRGAEFKVTMIFSRNSICTQIFEVLKIWELF